jgi:lipid II:glycine glycyltransferase (peptidoglycan interpeptide bridge formation enzyme)
VELRAGASVGPATLKPAFFAHTLDLGHGVERVRAGLASAVRRNLRKAEESALTVQISDKWQDVLKFYSLHMRTRRRHGLPPQSVTFFSNIYKHLMKRGLAFVVVAALQSRQIAAAVFLRAGRKAVYKFGASDERFQLRRANNLVMWRGIKCLMDSGADTLHFGRTSIENEGLRRFKRGWGSKEEPIVYSRLDPMTKSWSTPTRESSGLHNRIFQTLPLPVNRLLGTLCYPHLD